MTKKLGHERVSRKRTDSYMVGGADKRCPIKTPGAQTLKDQKFRLQPRKNYGGVLKKRTEAGKKQQTKESKKKDEQTK